MNKKVLPLIVATSSLFAGISVSNVYAQSADDLFAESVDYANGYGVPQDDSRAVSLTRQAAQMGHGEAQTWYGYFLVHGRGVPADPVTGFEWLRRGAETGMPESLGKLGEAYEEGWGTNGDLAAACRWYERAAALDDPFGTTSVGRCYEYGLDGRTVDYTTAVMYYRRGAELGNRRAKYGLGIASVEGRGVNRDDSIALRWFEESANAGYPDAMTRTGNLYRRGQGTARDDAAGVEWYRKAAAAGEPYAMHNLAYAYENGLGVARDVDQAIQWYEMAERNGHPEAGAKARSLAFMPPPIEEAIAQPTEAPAAQAQLPIGCARDGQPDPRGVGGFPCDCPDGWFWYDPTMRCVNAMALPWDEVPSGGILGEEAAPGTGRLLGQEELP